MCWKGAQPVVRTSFDANIVPTNILSSCTGPGARWCNLPVLREKGDRELPERNRKIKDAREFEKNRSHEKANYVAERTDQKDCVGVGQTEGSHVEGCSV